MNHMNDDLMKAIEQVAAHSESEIRMEQLRNFENNLAMTVSMTVRTSIITAYMGVADPIIKHELYTWSVQNGHHFADRVAQVVRILLRKELGIEE